MDFNSKNLKSILSSRVDPQLKEIIQKEAYENGMTASNYIEKLLEKREFILNFEEDADFKMSNEALEELELLKEELVKISKERDGLLEVEEGSIQTFEENRRLQNQLEENQKKIDELTSQYSSLKKSGIFFSDQDKQEFLRLVKKLKKYYPNISNNEIILESLARIRDKEKEAAKHVSKNNQEEEKKFPYMKWILGGIGFLCIGFLIRYLFKWRRESQKKPVAVPTRVNRPARNSNFRTPIHPFYWR